MKKTIGIVTILVVVTVLILLSFTIQIPYYVSGRGVIMPVEEWSLMGRPGGSLVHIYENHLKGVVSEYGVSEVQRGDIARYTFNEGLLRQGEVQKGDTLAWLYTSDVQLKIIELEGELSYQQSLLAVYLTGEKPEEIRVAENRIELARQELETQQALTGRMIRLFEEGVIARQEYELSVNDLKVREHDLEIAEAVYNTLTSGRKSEDINAVRSRVNALDQQIIQLKKHINAFHLVAPIGGTIIRERNPVMENSSDVILRIADFSSFVVLLPVDHTEETYLTPGQKVRINTGGGQEELIGELVTIDQTVRLINNRPKIFLTILINGTPHANLYRNMMVQARVESDLLGVWPYLARVSKTIYHN